MRKRELLWELPLSLPSYALNKVMRRRAYAAYARIGKQLRAQAGPPRWVILTELFDHSPEMLKVTLVIGPRWNPHAVLASGGPITVQHEIMLQAKTCQSAMFWTVEVLSAADRELVAVVGSRDQHDEWVRIPVPPGTYHIAVRYYECSPSTHLPAVKVDGADVLPTTPIAEDARVDDVGEYETMRHRCMHHYVFPMLSLKRWLPESFVRQEYLPVGNPQTTFLYGPVERGTTLRVQIPPETLERHLAYLSVYNRASFPVYTTRLQESDVRSPELQRGFYLIRLIPLINASDSDSTKISVTCV